MATIEEIRNLAEPLKSYQFKITIANAPGTGASGELLQFLCQASVLPGQEIDVVLTNLGGHIVSDPGRVGSAGRTWTVTFAESTDLSVVQRINSWQNICNNPATGVQGNRGDYKRTALVEMLDNAKEVVLTRQLNGVWPSATADMALDNASSEVVNLDVTWAFDYFVDQ